MPNAARVGVAVLDGQLLSSGIAKRARTARLRRDPRCVPFVFDAASAYPTLETTARGFDGPEVPELSLRLFRVMQHRPEGPLRWFSGEVDDDQFRAPMLAEARVVYEFDVHRGYGLS